MPELDDRHGLALSTRSPIAVERYVQGLDLQLSLNDGGVERLRSAVEADPEFALGHAALAFAAMGDAEALARRSSTRDVVWLEQATAAWQPASVDVPT
jgi:hypothetical protein